MGDSMMDTDALLSMSLDDLIKVKAKRNRSAPGVGGGGRGVVGGKIRSVSGRGARQKQTHPYARETPPRYSVLNSNNRVYVGNLAWGVSWKELKDCMARAGRVVKADVPEGPGGRSKADTMGIVLLKDSEGAARKKMPQKSVGIGRKIVFVKTVIRGRINSSPRWLVIFKTAADAQAAIDTLQDTELMGRPIYLREDREAAQTMQVPAASGGRSFGTLAANSGRNFGTLASNNGRHFGVPVAAGGDRNFGIPAVNSVGRNFSTGAPNCKVFLSNLAYEVTWQDLKDYMRNAGHVLHANVFLGNDGRSRGLGTVEFSKPYEAKNAISQLSGTELMGRPILIREDRGDSSNLGRGVGGAAGARVFVGNLSWQVAWQDLKDHMRQAGDVKFVDLFQEAGGRSKGCAVVEYEDSGSAHTAIRDLNDSVLMDRMMFIREDREEGSAASKSMGPMSQKHPGAEGRQVYVGNLSWETGWQELKDHFKQVGFVQFVEIPEDVQGRSKGYGTVRFAAEQGADRAIDELNNTELGGRTIFVKEDTH